MNNLLLSGITTLVLFSCATHQKTVSSSEESTSATDSINVTATDNSDTLRKQRINSMGEITITKPIKNIDISNPPVKKTVKRINKTP